MLRSFISLCSALLLLPALAFGADGDAWSGFVAKDQGQWRTEGYLICDGKLAADTTCAEFDLIADTVGGFPAFYVVAIDAIIGSCSGTPEFQLQGSHKTAGTLTNLGPQLTEAGIDAHQFQAMHQFLKVALTDDAGCATTGNDISLVLYYER